MKKKTLRNHVREAFAPGGPVEQAMAAKGRPYSRRSEQVDYALRVCELIEKSDLGLRTRVAGIEGETGTGKTLAYLLPLMFWCAINRKRAAVATFTLQLMDQIIGQDFPIALDAASRQLGKSLSLTVGKRIGKRNFLSPGAIERMQERVRGRDRKRDEMLVELKTIALNPGDGLWASAVERLGDQLVGIDPDAVCLRGEETSEAYLRHSLGARGADIVVTTHSTLLLNALVWFKIFEDEENPTEFLVVDEAHRLPDAAESLLRSKSPIRRIRKLVLGAHRLAGAPLKDIDEQLTGIQQFFDEKYEELGEGGELVIDASREPRAVRTAESAAEALSLADTLVRPMAAGEVHGTPTQRKRRAHAAAALLGDIRIERARLREFVDAARKDQVQSAIIGPAAPVLSWSPIKHYAGYETVPVSPARLLGRYWARLENEPFGHVRGILLTSATLGFQEGSEGAPVLVQECAVPHALREPSAAIAPDEFGKMAFVLADPRVPEPTLEKGGRCMTNPAWLEYGVCMVNAAAASGGRTLALVPSFADAEAIAARVPGSVVQASGERLAGAVKRFQDSRARVFITPGGWEGLDMGRARYWSHLVIVRMPFAPPDAARDTVMRNWLEWRFLNLERQGKTNGRTPSQRAEDSLFLRAMSKAIVKARQGLGRALRDPADSATVWIADPRFPRPRCWAGDERLSGPRVKPIHGMEKVIPARFLGDYEKARVFSMRGTVLSVNKRKAVRA